MTFYKWSKIANDDATADSSINWAEGMAPSAVNDSARGMMAALAKYRDDIGSNTQTSGTSTAYTLATNQVFDTLANMANKEFSFFAHATNGDSPTLNVDGLGSKPIVTDGTGVGIPAGTLITGGTYTVNYASSTGQFRLKNFYGNPFNIPIGGCLEYYGATVPNSSFVFPAGQAISRVTYATLFSIFGTIYGIGDGSTTFNVPDLTGRVPVMKEALATRLTSSFFGGNSTVLGAVGGNEQTVLTLAQLPTGITSSGSNSISVTSTVNAIVKNATILSFPAGGSSFTGGILNDGSGIAIGDPKTVGRVLLGISIVTIIVRLRTIRKVA